MGNRVQVHVFGDPGTEMMPDCGGCMCYKHTKKRCFCMISFFHLFTDWASRGRDLDDILVSFGDPGALCLIFEGLGDRLDLC